jgi:hypothetical protein
MTRSEQLLLWGARGHLYASPLPACDREEAERIRIRIAADTLAAWSRVLLIDPDTGEILETETKWGKS